MNILKTNPVSKQLRVEESINLWVGGIAVSLLLLGKYWYSQADTEALLFLLRPVSWLVHLFSNQPYSFVPGQGYYFPNGNLLINASCSGFNWLLLAYLLGVFAGLRFLRKPFPKIILLPILLPTAYLLCIVVNSMRIIFSIFITEQLAQHGSWLHLVEGTFVYLSSLIIWYFACQYFFKKINSQL